MHASLRQEGFALLVVVALLLTTGVANLLWSAGLPATSNPERLSPLEDPFPILPAASHLYVVPIPEDMNESTRLALLSLQGLVNRNRAELYLDFDNETGNASSMLTFLTQRYGITYDVVTPAWVYERYLPSLSGIVVYDPARPESVNILTMVAASRDAVIAGPDTAADLERTGGLPVLLDYASSNWTTVDAIGAYDRALREIYPASYHELVAILPPGQLAPRDYLIATRTFVFYDNQGALATPAELASTQRILAATPRGIPILGWFNSPTLTEENAFVQLASKYGKAIVGSEDVPNLSVLTALGRNDTHHQIGSPGPTLPLGNKTYAVVAVPDGDNLDFLAGRMRTLWAEPERGTLPLAWSLSPLLVDLAPPYLDFYYSTASSNDRFVAGPSGAGYLYPDYLGPGDLRPYLQATRSYLNASDMDTLWLLNAFTASEIPYRSATLSAYVDAIHPRGLVLDYDDQAKTQDSWMQAGGTAAAPVIRSTQMWTTTDNFYGKVGAAMATWDSGPHFLWITVYTFRFELRDAKTMVDTLSNRTGGNFVVVTPEQLFALMQEDFVARAQAQLSKMRADPLAATLFAPYLDAAQGRLDAPPSASEPSSRAYQAYLASNDLREAAFEEGVTLLGLVLVTIAAFALLVRPRRPSSSRDVFAEAPTLVGLGAAFALFMLALRAALAVNFWSYQWFAIGVVLAGIGRPLRRHLDAHYPRVSLLVIGALDLVFVALALGTNVAFALAAIGTVAVLDAILVRDRVRAEVLVLSSCLGSAAGFLLPVDVVAVALLAILLILPLAFAPRRTATEETTRAKGAWARGFVLTLPFAALAVAFNYSLGLRLGLQGASLPALAGILLVLAPIGGLIAARRWIASHTTTVEVVAFALATVFASVLPFITGTVATASALFGMVAALAVAAEASLRLFVDRGGTLSRVVATAVAWIPLFVLFFRMPPIVYSLTVVGLPMAIEYILYAPEIAVAAISAVLALVALFRISRASAALGD